MDVNPRSLRPERPSRRASRVPHRLVTGDELALLSRKEPCELVRGRVVCASPTSPEHGGTEGNFYFELRSFVLERKLGKVLVGEVGIYTGRDPDTVRAADVLYISSERLARRAKKGGFLDVAPDLVVEVLSPDDSDAEIEEKVAEYLACGVRLVWVADPATRSVRSYRSGRSVQVFGETDLLSGEDVLEGFDVEVARLFAG
jgi:Uma2 family endonuclease